MNQDVTLVLVHTQLEHNTPDTNNVSSSSWIITMLGLFSMLQLLVSSPRC